MAGNLKGLTIELAGDTTKLDKALKDIDAKTSSLSRELGQINKLLKLDPTNVSLLAQKQKVLSEAIENTSKKLDTLKDAEKQVQAQFERGEASEEQVRALQREIIATENKLKGYEAAAKETADAVDDLGKESEDASDNVDDLGKESKDTSDEVDDLGKAAKDAGDDVDDLGDETKDAGEAAEDAAGGFDTAGQAVGTFLGNLALDVLREAVSLLKDIAGSVLETGMQFSSSMSEVAAISGATGEELEQLEATAREFGSTTTFSASEAADALKYMALAGWSTQESIDGLPGVLNLAASSGMDLAAASDMVTDYLSAFGLEASDSTRFADMLAYAQSNANTTAEGLGEAYKNCAANLNAAGQDIETTTSLLSMMANQGLKGSEAGTALTAVMRDLTAKMKNGAIEIGDTSIAVMDANGNYRDLTDILFDVEKATDGMGDAEKAAALSSTFTADSIKGLNLMLNAGVDEAASFEEQLRNSGGSAAEMAEVMNDNLSGDIKEMQSAFEELALKLYDRVEPALRAAAEFVTTKVVPALETLVNNLPAIGVALAGVSAAVVAFKLSALAAKAATEGMTLAQKAAAAAQTVLNAVMNANPIGLIILAITALVTAFMLLWKNCESFREFWKKLWEGIKTVALGVADAFKALPGKIYNAIKGAVDKVKQWGTDLVKAAKTKASEMKDKVVSTLKELPGKIWTAIKDAVTKVAKWGLDMQNKAKTAALNLVTGVINNLKALPGKIWTAIKGAITNVTKWGSDMVSKAKTAMGKVVSGVVSTLSQLPKKVLSIGANLVTGLWNGINNKLKWLKDKIAGFTKAVLNGIKAFFGVHSPSTETAWIGEMLDQGLAKGVLDNVNAPIKAMRSVSSDVLGAATGDLDGLAVERSLQRGTSPVAATAAIGGDLGVKLDKILTAIERGQILTIDGDALVGATAAKMDSKLGQRRALAARGAV